MHKVLLGAALAASLLLTACGGANIEKIVSDCDNRYYELYDECEELRDTNNSLIICIENIEIDNPWIVENNCGYYN